MIDPFGVPLLAIGCLSVVMAYLFQKHVINKGIARGGLAHPGRPLTTSI